jgi:hypothetical protein
MATKIVKTLFTKIAAEIGLDLLIHGAEHAHHFVGVFFTI